MSLEYNKNLIPFAKSLRKNAAPQENHFWYDFLRAYPIRFQRQKTIGQLSRISTAKRPIWSLSWTAPSTSPRKGHTYDEARTAAIETFGVAVLRFTNREIDSGCRAVCTQIEAAVRARLQ